MVHIAAPDNCRNVKVVEMAEDRSTWAARRADIQQLLAMTASDLAHLVRPAAEAECPLMSEAAYFARCQRLLVGMLTLVDEGLPDLSGVALRPLYECWLRGMWLLHKGQEAYDKLVAVGEATVKVWTDRRDAGDWVARAEWVNFQELGALTLTKELAPIVAGHAISRGPALLETYNLAYGLLSERDVHHGLEGIVGHIVSNGDGFLRIGLDRPEPGAREDVAWGAHLLITFALALYPRFGLPTGEFDALASLRPDVLLGEWRPRNETTCDRKGLI